MLRYRLILLGYTLIYWNVVIRLAIFLRILGSRDDSLSEALSKGMSFAIHEVLLSSVVISVFATLSWYAIHIAFPKMMQSLKHRKWAFGVFFVDVILFLSIAIALGIVHYSVERSMPLWEAFVLLPHFLFNPTILFFLIVLLIGTFVYQLINTLLHQIGYMPLGRILSGYYQKPREEELIFMFLDLQSSTSVAEKLGHERYSCFIQDCFKCVSNALLCTRGRVYQFVGDEVVITWDAQDTRNFKRAIDFFFLCEDSLRKRRPYFEKEYGIFPHFSAALNVGKVMAAEVGEIKRELAFHGDVVNTAARIQKRCKHYGEKILVTEAFAQPLKLANDGEYRIDFVDTVRFKGKNRVAEVYSVKTNTEK